MIACGAAPEPRGRALTVIDNGTNDTDPTTGALQVTDLAWGEYTLRETKALASCDRTTETFTVVIDAEHLTVTFGSITNTPTPVPPPAVTPGGSNLATTGYQPTPML